MLFQQNQNQAQIFNILGQLKNRLQGLSGAPRRAAALSHLQAAGVMAHNQDGDGLQRFLLSAPGPYGATMPQVNDFDAFLDDVVKGSLLPVFDPIGGDGGRYAGQGRQARPVTIWDRPGADLYSLGTGALAGGDITDTLTVEISGDYTEAVLLFNTAEGRVKRITSLEVDGQPFHFGEGGVMGANMLDLGLEYHPGRNGIYLGDLSKTIEIIVDVETSDAATWEAYVHGLSRQARKFRPMGAMIPSLGGGLF